MKSLLIKIGKAWNVLSRDGFVLGSKRILKAFFSQFKKVDRGDVLFITGGVGDSAMYRAHNVAEELDQNGIMTSLAYADNPFLLRYVKNFKVFVFHRTPYTDKIRRFIGEIKKENKEIIFDTDDLLYDAEFAKKSDYYENITHLERKLYENGLGGEIVVDPYVKVCTTTTSYLADRLKEKNKKVFVVPNKLSLEDLSIANKLIDNQKDNDGKVRVGYFSGTISHNKDFATVTDALVKMMERHLNVELFLVGPLDVENKLVSRFRDRIVQLPYAPREDHFENISKVDINIAPLEMGDPYCESKSELKFFEAGAVGVPTVAVRNRTFKEAISEGVDGFLAGSEEEWLEALEKLILDSDLRLKIGLQARKKALERYNTNKGKNSEYYEFLKEKIRQ